MNLVASIKCKKSVNFLIIVNFTPYPDPDQFQMHLNGTFLFSLIIWMDGLRFELLEKRNNVLWSFVFEGK